MLGIAVASAPAWLDAHYGPDLLHELQRSLEAISFEDTGQRLMDVIPAAVNADDPASLGRDLWFFSLEADKGYNEVLGSFACTFLGFLDSLNDISLPPFASETLSQSEPGAGFHVKNVTASSLELHCHGSASLSAWYGVSSMLYVVARKYYNLELEVSEDETHEGSLPDAKCFKLKLLPGYVGTGFTDMMMLQASSDVGCGSRYSLDADIFSDLFPFHFLVDLNGSFVQVGDGLRKLHATVGSSAAGCFKIMFPFAMSWDRLESFLVHGSGNRSSTVLLGSSGGLQLKGCFYRTQLPDNYSHTLSPVSSNLAWNGILFVGAPRFTNISDVKRHGLCLSDLSPYDVSLDMLTMSADMSSMESEISGLTDELRLMKLSNDRSHRPHNSQQHSTSAIPIVLNESGEIGSDIVPRRMLLEFLDQLSDLPYEMVPQRLSAFRETISHGLDFIRPQPLRSHAADFSSLDADVKESLMGMLVSPSSDSQYMAAITATATARTQHQDHPTLDHSTNSEVSFSDVSNISGSRFSNRSRVQSTQRATPTQGQLARSPPQGQCGTSPRVQLAVPSAAAHLCSLNDAGMYSNLTASSSFTRHHQAVKGRRSLDAGPTSDNESRAPLIVRLTSSVRSFFKENVSFRQRASDRRPSATLDEVDGKSPSRVFTGTPNELVTVPSSLADSIRTVSTLLPEPSLATPNMNTGEACIPRQMSSTVLTRVSTLIDPQQLSLCPDEAGSASSPLMYARSFSVTALSSFSRRARHSQTTLPGFAVGHAYSGQCAVPSQKGRKPAIFGLSQKLDVLVRISKSPSEELTGLLSHINDWQFDTFALESATGGRPLSYLAFALFKQANLVSMFRIDEAKLARFLIIMEEGYNKHPYHNRTHAADVLRSMHVIATRGGLIQRTTPESLMHMDDIFSSSNLGCAGMSHVIEVGKVDDNNESRAPPANAQLAAHEAFVLLTMYLAAIVHDYDHRGVNNNFLVRSRDPLALLYNDTSPQESHHVAAAFTTMHQKEFNFLRNVSDKVFDMMRAYVIELVLSTDMKQHFSTVSAFEKKSTSPVPSTTEHFSTVSAFEKKSTSPVPSTTERFSRVSAFEKKSTSPVPSTTEFVPHMYHGLSPLSQRGSRASVLRDCSSISSHGRSTRPSTRDVSAFQMIRRDNSFVANSFQTQAHGGASRSGGLHGPSRSQSPRMLVKDSRSPTISCHLPVLKPCTVPITSSAANRDRHGLGHATSSSSGSPLGNEAYFLRTSLHSSESNHTSGNAFISSHVSQEACEQLRTKATYESCVASAPLEVLPLDDDTRMLFWKVALKCADIGHLTSPPSVHRKWVVNLEEEMFRQGDQERARGFPVSALMDREKTGITKSQPGFFNVVALPMYVAAVRVFPALRPLLEGLQENKRMWEACSSNGSLARPS